MAIDKLYSLEAPDTGDLPLALVGDGPALNVLADLLGRLNLAATFPRLKIVAWVPEPDASEFPAEKRLPPELKKARIVGDIAGLFSSFPDIFLVMDLSPSGAHLASLRSLAPASCSIISSDLLLRVCSAADRGLLLIGGGENLRKAEKLFALLVDQMDEDILILDEKGIIIDANRHAAASLGMLPGELAGLSCGDFGDKDCFCGENESPFKEAVSRERRSHRTFARTLENGRVRYMHAVCFPVAGALGGAPRYLYIRRDVTEQHQLEQRLQQTEKMAAIGELSMYIAHEIRNPLFSIGGFANALLRNTSLNDVAREKARIIYDESRRLDQILSNILNFARPTEQVMGVFSVAEVAAQTMELMTVGGEERKLKAILDVEPNLPMARGNAENLKQCLINLIKNAMEAMPGGGTLTVVAVHAHDYVSISVSDTGMGVPPELQEQIFSPFYTTKHGGAGLGLAMTRKVIREMGGRVTLESRSGEGTKVTLTLPVALDVSDAASSDNEILM